MRKNIELEIEYQEGEKKRLICEAEYSLAKGEIFEAEYNKIRRQIEVDFIQIMREIRGSLS